MIKNLVSPTFGYMNNNFVVRSQFFISQSQTTLLDYMSPSLSLFSLCRSNGSILHNLIVHNNQSNGGYTLNNVTSQVLYKVIHYFMENPINGKTVLRYPIPDRTVSTYN